ncbi:cyclin-T2-like protein [Lates japonicus]|uniref:Cyclin-T2-like protein n=1 Tax=Lates japonicus TaxID=270547 RepID=A0AAD3NK90_LATJO|nr:cyclin-T2-like protein [Lates japonicus]
MARAMVTTMTPRTPTGFHVTLCFKEASDDVALQKPANNNTEYSNPRCWAAAAAAAVVGGPPVRIRPAHHRGVHNYSRMRDGGGSGVESVIFSQIISQTTLFLAAVKLREQPRKPEHVIKIAHACINPQEPALDTKSNAFQQQTQELVALKQEKRASWRLRFDNTTFKQSRGCISIGRRTVRSEYRNREHVCFHRTAGWLAAAFATAKTAQRSAGTALSHAADIGENAASRLRAHQPEQRRWTEERVRANPKASMLPPAINGVSPSVFPVLYEEQKKKMPCCICRLMTTTTRSSRHTKSHAKPQNLNSLKLMQRQRCLPPHARYSQHTSLLTTHRFCRHCRHRK